MYITGCFLKVVFFYMGSFQYWLSLEYDVTILGLLLWTPVIASQKLNSIETIDKS